LGLFVLTGCVLESFLFFFICGLFQMTEPIHLTNFQARRFLLAKHGLWPPRALTGKDGVMAVFDRLACIQFDPLDVVGRNPDLVLQSRVADYRPDMLYELTYVERRLYDYWDKMMSIVPMRDWPKQALRRRNWREHHAERRARHAEHVETVLAVVREQGPMSSLDFKGQHGVAWKTDWRWGEMKVAKALLEMLGDTGELMVSHRQGARRYYDLAGRVVPEEIAARPLLTDEEAYLNWKVARGCQGIGLIGPGMGDAWGGIIKAPERDRAIEALVERGEMAPVQIEGDRRTYHLLTRDLPYLEQVHATAPTPRVAFIAPLDNLLWSRNLIERLFGFRYVWEVYKPAHERRYGYYVLPVLYGDRFVARFEPKLDRGEGELTILSWHWEPGESLTDELTGALRKALTHFMDYLGAERLVVADGVDPELAALSAGL
jgi:uncharacterized protein YcaQ